MWLAGSAAGLDTGNADSEIRRPNGYLGFTGIIIPGCNGGAGYRKNVYQKNPLE